MKKIDTKSGCDYTRLFFAEIDRKAHFVEAVGIDGFENLILHRSRKGNIRNKKDPDGEFYILSEEEYCNFLDKARENRLVSRWKYKRLQKRFQPEESRKRIETFEIITLHISGMRYTHEYEIVAKGNTAEVVKYSIRYGDGDERRIPQNRAECSIEEVLEIVNRCRLIAWDGFHGKHPKNIKDGTMFTLRAVVNGGRSIYATGSQNFPRHYTELTNWFTHAFGGA